MALVQTQSYLCSGVAGGSCIPGSGDPVTLDGGADVVAFFHVILGILEYLGIKLPLSVVGLDTDPMSAQGTDLDCDNLDWKAIIFFINIPTVDNTWFPFPEFPTLFSLSLGQETFCPISP